jgi:CBS domain containing-hemolysin-like protein
MIPRTEVIAIDSRDSLDEVLAVVDQQQHTRYPVYEEDLDHVLGILDAKDLLKLLRTGRTDWLSLIKPAVAVPESVSVETAIAAMRANQVQIVILVDEHGGTAGILTADEVLYRLLGRWLGAAGRPGGKPCVSCPPGTSCSPGSRSSRTSRMQPGLSSRTRITTPWAASSWRGSGESTSGDRVEVPGYEFRVMGMDGRRVDRVLVVKRASEPARAR